MDELKLECSHTGGILALFLKTAKNKILVGDLMRSMTVLEVSYTNNKFSISEIARDFNSVLTRGVDIIDDSNFLGSDEKGNIFIMKRNKNAATEDQRGRLEMQSTFHIGDFANCFHHGSLSSNPTATREYYSSVRSSQGNELQATSATLETKSDELGLKDDGELNDIKLDFNSGKDGPILFGTVCGMIGTVLEIDEDTFLFLSAVERAVRQVVKRPGNLSHEDWRQYYHERRHAYGRKTIDGDIVETFQELDSDQMNRVVKFVNQELLELSESNSSKLAKCKETNVNGSSSSKSSLFQEMTSNEISQRVEQFIRSY